MGIYKRRRQRFVDVARRRRCLTKLYNMINTSTKIENTEAHTHTHVTQSQNNMNCACAMILDGFIASDDCY